MKCRDCRQEITGKFVNGTDKDMLEFVVCQECANKYLTIKEFGTDFEFCDKCGVKEDKAALKEVKKKKDLVKVCRQCFDDLCGIR